MNTHHILIERFDELPVLAAKAHFHPGAMAKLLRISLRTFERQCRKEFKLTPEQLLQKLWLNEADSLLDHRKAPKEINEELGCHSVNDFYRKYKKTRGMGMKHRPPE